MKNFDISNLQLVSISDVRRVNHIKDTEAGATASHCAFIIRKNGSSVYTVDKNVYVADSDTLLFIAKGTKYSMSVEKSGECTVPGKLVDRRYAGGAMRATIRLKDGLEVLVLCASAQQARGEVGEDVWLSWNPDEAPVVRA